MLLVWVVHSFCCCCCCLRGAGKHPFSEHQDGFLVPGALLAQSTWEWGLAQEREGTCSHHITDAVLLVSGALTHVRGHSSGDGGGNCPPISILAAAPARICPWMGPLLLKSISREASTASLAMVFHGLFPRKQEGNEWVMGWPHLPPSLSRASSGCSHWGTCTWATASFRMLLRRIFPSSLRPQDTQLSWTWSSWRPIFCVLHSALSVTVYCFWDNVSLGCPGWLATSGFQIPSYLIFLNTQD